MVSLDAESTSSWTAAAVQSFILAGSSQAGHCKHYIGLDVKWEVQRVAFEAIKAHLVSHLHSRRGACAACRFPGTYLATNSTLLGTIKQTIWDEKAIRPKWHNGGASKPAWIYDQMWPADGNDNVDGCVANDALYEIIQVAWDRNKEGLKGLIVDSDIGKRARSDSANLGLTGKLPKRMKRLDLNATANEKLRIPFASTNVYIMDITSSAYNSTLQCEVIRFAYSKHLSDMSFDTERLLGSLYLAGKTPITSQPKRRV